MNDSEILYDLQITYINKWRRKKSLWRNSRILFRYQFSKIIEIRIIRCNEY